MVHRVTSGSGLRAAPPAGPVKVTEASAGERFFMADRWESQVSRVMSKKKHFFNFQGCKDLMEIYDQARL